MSIFHGLTGNRQVKEECARAWGYLQKTSGFPLNAEIIKQTQDDDGWKRYLGGGI